MLNQSIRRIPALLVLALFAALFASPASAMVLPEHGKDASEGSDVVPGHYIVVLEDSVKGPAAVAKAQTEQRDGELGFVYRHALKGYSAELSKGAVKALRKDPRVKYVDPVRRFEIASQTTPTGIDRIFASANEALDIDEEDDVRIDADVAVIDTGIDFDHPDLNVAGRTNCVPPGKLSEPLAEECVDDTGIDDHGHGTHVAGTIGALDNEEGVVGVAPGARLWAVKVLTPSLLGASGSTPWIVAGIDWVTATREDEDPENDIEVANMSLGGPGSNPALDEAIEGSVQAGVVYAVAAGNQAWNAKDFSPASSPDVITVSALADYDGAPGGEAEPTCSDRGPDDTLANFSNWGKEVEIAAPGVCILSTLPGNEYGSLSGTSMASPHVAGAAAVLASEYKPQSAEDVEAIRQQLINDASLDWSDNSGDFNREPLLYLDDEVAPLEGATEIATWIGIEGATLNGSIEARGPGTTYRFEYGTTTSYGSLTPVQVTSGSGHTKVSQPISGLSPGTTYHYRLVLESLEGTVTGEDRTFTTTPWSAQSLPVGQWDELNAISCASGSECTAVGNEGIVYELENDPFFKYGLYRVPLAYRWSAGKWEKLAAHAPNEKGDGFDDVSCASATFCMAVGGPIFSGSASDHIPWTQHWDGSEWSVESIEIPADTAKNSSGKSHLYLNSVSCTSATSCIAVGKYPIGYTKTNSAIERALIEIWDGKAWQALAPPSEAPGLAGISCPAAGSCVAVGGTDSLIITMSEGKWSAQQVSTGSPSHDVSCDKVNRCLAVWEKSAKRWNGTTWSSLPSPERPVTDISCTQNLCLALQAGNEYVERWDGPFEKWVPQQLAVPLDKVGEIERGTPRASDVSCLPAACMTISESPQRLRLTTARTESASAITSSGATLNGTVNPHGTSTLYQFEYGTTTAYSAKVPVSLKEAGSGTKDVKVSESISGLKAGTTYHFRLAAYGPAGIAYGEDLTFTPPGPPLATTEGATEVNNKGATLNATVNPNGLATTYNFEYGPTTSYGTKVPVPAKSIGAGKEAVKVTEKLSGLQAGVTYHYRVVATNEAGSVNGEDQTFATPQIEAPSFSFAFGSQGSGEGALESPRGVTFDSEGNVWVADTGNDRVQKFSPKGEFIASYGETGTGLGQFQEPTAIASAPSNGLIWVADTGNDRIQAILESSGEPFEAYGSAGSGKGQLSEPRGIAADPNGDVWVADTGNDRIQRVTFGGEFTPYGSSGSGNGQFSEPSGIAYTPNDSVWVADTGNERLQKLDAAGKYLLQTGTEGEATLSEPTGLATDAQSNVWVTDSANHRVVGFTREGAYRTHFGAQGSGEGQFSSPRGITVDQEGDVWVTDTANHRIQKWLLPPIPTLYASGTTSVGATEAKLFATINPNGSETTYQIEYGTTTAYGSKAPAAPKSIGSGTSLVESSETLTGLSQTTTYHFRVIASSAKGTVIGQDQSFTTKKVGPTAATEAATAVYPTEATLNGYVNPNGKATTYQFEYGTTTSYGTKVPVSPKELGSGTSPVNVAEKLSGLKLGTTYHFRIVATNAEATANGNDRTFTTEPLPPLAKTTPATEVLMSKATLRGEVNPNGSATTYQFEYGTTTSYGAKVPASPKSAGSGTSYVAASEAISGLKADTTYHYRIVATSNVDIATGADQTFKTLASEPPEEIEPPAFELAFGSFGEEAGQFQWHEGIAADKEGNLWVTDAAANRVQKFDPEGEYLAQFGSQGSANGQLQGPTGIAIDKEGNVWLADSGNNRIQKFNAKGEYLAQLGSAGSGNGQFSAPYGIAIDASGNLWVTDSGNNRIQKFNAKGEYLAQLGSAGSGNGQFSAPYGIAIDASGNLWVADSGNYRIQKFSSEGKYVLQFGEAGMGDGQFNVPVGLAFDFEGRLWVTDSFIRVQGFDSSGQYVGQFEEGQLSTPTGIAADAEGDLWVTDVGYGEVQKWGFGP